MQVVFIILGGALVAAGLYFAVKNIASANAGAEAAKSFSVTGPSWLILVAIGAGVIVYGGVLYKPSLQPTISPTPPTEVSEPFDYGDDPVLDAIYDRCADGSMSACDNLFLQSPPDSNYEAFGAFCGLRVTEPPPDMTCRDVDPDATIATAVVG
jgi:hypothetical protein